MSIRCLFCDYDIDKDYIPFGDMYKPNDNTYICARCGIVRLTYEAYSDFPSSHFSETDKTAMNYTPFYTWLRKMD